MNVFKTKKSFLTVPNCFVDGAKNASLKANSFSKQFLRSLSWPITTKGNNILTNRLHLDGI